MLGFNTIDAMMWEFYWNNWSAWSGHMWHWTPTLRFDVWLSYFLGGILPLVVGSVVLGWFLREIT